MKMFKVCVVGLVLVLGGMMIAGCSSDKAEVEKVALAWLKAANAGTEVPLTGSPVITFDDKKESAAVEMILKQDGSHLTLLCLKSGEQWGVADCASVPGRHYQ